MHTLKGTAPENFYSFDFMSPDLDVEMLDISPEPVAMIVLHLGVLQSDVSVFGMWEVER